MQCCRSWYVQCSKILSDVGKQGSVDPGPITGTSTRRGHTADQNQPGECRSEVPIRTLPLVSLAKFPRQKTVGLPWFQTSARFVRHVESFSHGPRLSCTPIFWDLSKHQNKVVPQRRHPTFNPGHQTTRPPPYGAGSEA